MFQIIPPASFSKVARVCSGHVSSQAATSGRSISANAPSYARKNTFPFKSISDRRVQSSPTLPLEAVALPPEVKQQVHKCIARQSMSARELRLNASTINVIRASESLGEKPIRNRGQPIVQPPPHYDSRQTAAYAALRMPGAFAANIFVMAEAARLLPDFTPSSILDFGSGPSTSLMAASRVFRQSQSVRPWKDRMKDHPSIQVACFVDTSAHMRSLAAEIARADPGIDDYAKITQVASLQECRRQGASFDIVTCSYSLNEVVRSAISSTPKDHQSLRQKQSVRREDRLRLAEKRLRRTAMTLWSRTAPNGLFIIIEDGTAAGFETVAFVRDLILKSSPPTSGSADKSNPEHVKREEAADEDCSTQKLIHPATRAHVVAPCLHSRSCPLNGSITRHRICRFQQRLNRPLYSRTALPMSTGYEDEYLSFLVVRKIVTEEQVMQDVVAEDVRWGRLIRPPLLKGKHVALDACTKSGTLERRMISKKNAADGQYSQARRAKWGDIWSKAPSTAPQTLNF